MIAEQNAPRLIRLLPVAVVVTVLIAVAPMGVVWAARATDLVSSPPVAATFGVLLSLLGSCLVGLWWERRRGSRDVLFADLTIWGWLRRYLIERRVASAAELLGLDRTRASGHELTFSAERFSAERQARALEQLASSLEARDPYTHGHSRRVARYATMIARRMRLAPPEVARIRAAAAVHDVGKIETPIAILHKQGRLTDAEFDAIKRHPADGARMVALLGDDELTAIVRHHHERLDGTGYPDGLSGCGIPLGARIIAVADTFDAITSERPYRRAKAHRAAIELLRREAGDQLDPDAVSAFCSVYFGRRALGAWIGVTNALEALVSWFGAGTIGLTARGAAIVASVAALGAGAVALPAPATRSSAHQARVRSATATHGRGDQAETRAFAVARPGERARLLRDAGRADSSLSGRATGAGAATGASAPARTTTAAGSAPTAGAAGGSENSGSGGSGSGGSSGGGSGTTTVAATDGAPAAGVPAASVTVTPGPSGGLPSLAVAVGGTTAASAGGTPNGGVGVTVGGTGGVGISAGGTGSPAVGVTVGGGSSGIPPVNVSVP